MSKFTIIGSGALGTAFLKVLVDAGHKDVVVYGINESELCELEKGMNTKYFPNFIELPNAKITTNIEKAVSGSDYIIFAVPSQTIPGLLVDIKKYVNSKTLLVNGSKGFYSDSLKFLHKGIEENIKDNKNIRGVVSLRGPSFATEIIKREQTIVCAVSDSKDKTILEEVQNKFQNEYFHIYKQTDVIGAEVGSIYKNVLAIVMGIAHEQGFNINTISALITSGLKEMSIFAKSLGGKIKTVMGLTGMGDLILTATSKKSRNFSLGINMVKNEKNFFESKTVCEGFTALKFIYTIGKTKKLDLPIISALYSVIYKKAKLKDLILNLVKVSLNTFE